MNITELFEMQRVLDERIIKEHGLEGKDLLQERVLALNVELAELAQETRCFKFWSKNQQPSDRVLDELVDVLHFMLSVTLDSGEEWDVIAEFEDGMNAQFNERTGLTDAFNRMFEEITTFQIGSSIIGCWIIFIDLYLELGFEFKDLYEAYKEKNAENHARQDRGY